MNPITASAKTRLIPTAALFAWCSLFAADNPLFAHTWIVTNTVAGRKLPIDYIEEIDLTPSVNTNVANASSFDSSAARLLLRARERLIVVATASGRTGGKIMADYDVRADLRVDGGINAAALTYFEALLVSSPLVKVRYFRGRVLYTATRILSDEWITVFTSEDRRRLVAVHDAGTILISEDTGSTWRVIDHAGDYEFTLSTTPEGSVLVAKVTVAERPTAITSAPHVHQMTTQNWYSAVSAADGSRLVLTGGPSQSAPALSISSTNGSLIVAWPASYTGLILQRNSDLGTTNWINVTNSVEVTDVQNQAVLPMLNARDFFRLTTR